MFCEKCGTRLPDDAVFCENCGNKVSQESYIPPQFQEPETEPQPVEKKSSGGIGKLILTVLLLAVLAGGGYLIWHIFFEVHDPGYIPGPYPGNNTASVTENTNQDVTVTDVPQSEPVVIPDTPQSEPASDNPVPDNPVVTEPANPGNDVPGFPDVPQGTEHSYSDYSTTQKPGYDEFSWLAGDYFFSYDKVTDTGLLLGGWKAMLRYPMYGSDLANLNLDVNQDGTVSGTLTGNVFVDMEGNFSENMYTLEMSGVLMDGYLTLTDHDKLYISIDDFREHDGMQYAMGTGETTSGTEVTVLLMRP
ncbi:MAG: zinc ribbon domain-containing protein [Solobacterium sp.]|nr:zinc ribbon domain-containing protein [Solobacterium sp.]